MMKKYDEDLYESFDSDTDGPIKNLGSNSKTDVIEGFRLLNIFLIIILLLIGSVVGLMFWEIKETMNEYNIEPPNYPEKSDQQDEFYYDDEFSNTYDVDLNIYDVEQFNQTFEDYTGVNISGNEVEDLLATVLVANENIKESNFTREDLIRVLMYIGPEYTKSEILYDKISSVDYDESIENLDEFLSEIRTDKEYIVEIHTYNSEGYVSEIMITDMTTYPSLH